MGSSNIKATVKHTKIALEANSVDVRPLFNETLPDCLWSNQKFPFLVRPAFVNSLGVTTPVFYRNTSNLVVDTGIVSSNTTVIEELQTSAWSQSTSACDVLRTGCYAIEVEPYIMDATPVLSYDECNNLKEILVNNQQEQLFSFEMDHVGSNTNLNNSKTFTIFSNQDPFSLHFVGGENSLLEKVDRFDVEDYFGNGLLFSNPNSRTSNLLNNIFSDSFTNSFQEKIKNFGDNIINPDGADIFSLEKLSEMVGDNSNEFLINSPTELENLVKLGSLTYQDVFGSLDTFSKYNQNNVGELLSLDTTINVGERLLYQKTDEPESSLEVLVVPFPTSLSAIDNSLLSGDNTFDLSALNVDGLDPDQHCFWRIAEDPSLRINNKILIDCLSAIPSQTEWLNLLEKKIQKNLLDNI